MLDETLTLLARRSSYSFAVDRARSLYASASLEIVRPSNEDEFGALALFEKFADQDVRFTDCVSFALMKRQGVRRAFAFDRHFRDVASSSGRDRAPSLGAVTPGGELHFKSVWIVEVDAATAQALSTQFLRR
ncbi:MAG: type II toxin-antitoxin system VapC family toxin [Vicinamibacteria bacterium]